MTTGKISIAKDLALLAPIMSLILIQYNSLYLLLTEIGGNIFINCCVCGSGEILAGMVSGFLLGNFKDTKVFHGANILAATFYTTFFYVPAGIP